LWPIVPAKLLVNDEHPRGVLGVRLAGHASSEEGNPHRLEVAPAHDADPGKLLVLDPRLGSSRDLKPGRRTEPTHRQVVREADAEHAGQVFDARQQLLAEGSNSVLTVVRRRGEGG